MKLSKALLMAIVLVLLALFVWNNEQQNLAAPPPGSVKQTHQGFPKALFPDLDLREINRVGIKHSDQAFDFVKSSRTIDPLSDLVPAEGKFGTWVMLSPAGAPTNPRKVEEIIETIGSAQLQNQIAEDEVEDDISAYGLKEPALWLVFATSEGEQLITFGKKVGMSGRRYLQIRGEKKISLVDEKWFQRLLVDKDQVRNQFPADCKPENVLKLTLNRQNLDDVVFQRKNSEPGAKWELAEESKSSASFELDDRLIDQALADLAKLKVKTFADNLSDRGVVKSVTEPRTIIGMEIKNEFAESGKDSEVRTLSLFFGEQTVVVDNSQTSPAEEQTLRQTNFYLRVAGKPWIYEMERAVPLDLQQPLAHFRNKSPFASIDDSSVKKILLYNADSDSPSFLLQRKDEAWSAALGPNFEVADLEASAEKVSWWLERFRAFRVLTYPVLNVDQQRQYKIDDPVFRAEVFVEGRLESYKLVVAAPVELALDGESGGSLEKSPEEINQLPRFAALRSREDRMLSAIVGQMNWRPLVQDLDFFLKK